MNTQLQKTLSIRYTLTQHFKLFNDNILCRIVLQKRHTSDGHLYVRGRGALLCFRRRFGLVLQTRTGQLALQKTKSVVLLVTMADPELQKRGGHIFAEIFERPFFRRFLTKFQHFPQKFHLSPKISDDPFQSSAIFCFNMLFFRRGGQICSPHRLGGTKFLNLHKFTILSLLFLPPRGELHCQLR